MSAEDDDEVEVKHLDAESEAEEEDAWRPASVAKGVALFLGILGFLYFFLVGLDLLGRAFKVAAGDSAGTLFTVISNPLAGFVVGILATVLVQSSSTTSAIVVTAVASGVLGVQTAIPVILGANIGTSVTNTIVSLGFVGDIETYRRGFAGATVHDAFNFMNVLIWLPAELISSAINGGDGGVLFLISDAIARSFSACEGDCQEWEGPFQAMTSAIADSLIVPDSDVIKDFSFGRPSASFVQCQALCRLSADCAYVFNQQRCASSPLAEPDTVCGNTLIFEDNSTLAVADDEPAAFVFCNASGFGVLSQAVVEAAQAHYDGHTLNKAGILHDAGLDQEAGIIVLFLSLAVLLLSLLGMVRLLNIAVKGPAQQVLKRALNMPGVVAIVVGTGVTILVQSSSITTSTLTPLVAVGTLTLEGMLPLTLGANIGTTLTGILAALVGSSVLGFQIAMVHVLFNVFGVVLLYPIPRVRAVPIAVARKLGDLAATYRVFPIVYICVFFLGYPAACLLLSIGFDSDSTGALAATAVGLVAILGTHVLAYVWYSKRGGRQVLLDRFGRVQPDVEDGLRKGDNTTARVTVATAASL